MCVVAEVKGFNTDTTEGKRRAQRKPERSFDALRMTMLVAWHW
jgi:hypothetical protein